MTSKLRAVPKNGFQEIRVEDLGPIYSFAFRMPKRGGIDVLQGQNGLGKTHILKGVDALLTGYGKKELEHRDGATSGIVEGFGVTLRIGRSATRRGELEVVALESTRFSPFGVLEFPVSSSTLRTHW